MNKVRQYGKRSIPTLKDKVEFADIVNDTTTGGTQKPLSAEMGKSLNTKVNTEIADRSQAIVDLKDGVSASNSTLKKIEDNLNQEVADRNTAIESQNTTMLSAVDAEKTRAQASELVLTNAVAKEVSDRQTALSNEESRATAEEARIEAKLETETSDRQADTASLTLKIDTDVTAEKTRAESAEASLASDLSNEATARTSADTAINNSITALDSKVNANKTAIDGSLATEITNRTSADSALSSRLSAVESGLVAGVVWKGAVANLTELDALVESEQVSGWAYYVADEKDVYVVLPEIGGDYAPSAWSAKSFLKIADFKELTGLVTSEKNRALGAEGVLSGAIDAEVTSRTNEITRVESIISALDIAYKAQDVVIDNKINAEHTDRKAEIAALDTAYKNADSVLDGKITTEKNARISAVAAEKTRAESAEGTLSTRLDVVEGDDTVNGSIAKAVKTENTRALSAEGVLNGLITQEQTDRTSADLAEKTRAESAESALDARLDVVESDKLTAGSVAFAQFEAQKYADKWIPMMKLEGAGGTLMVSGDSITTTYAPMQDGVIMGEVIVYAGDNDNEALGVSVASIAGSTITLDTVTAGEFDGKQCKVQYMFREGDQVGAGMGVAGEGGAGA